MRCRLPWRRADRLVLASLLSLLLAGAAGATGREAGPTVPPIAGATTGAATGTAAGATAGTTAGITERLILSPTLNGTPVDGEPILVRRRGVVLTMRTADLRALGIAVRGDAVDTDLRQVPGLAATIDDGHQVIALTWRAPRTRAIDRLDQRDAVTPNGWGAALNYDLAATRAAGRTTLAGLVDGVVFGPRGYFFGGAIVSSIPTGVRGRHVALLDVGYTTGDPYAARRVTLGHLIPGATERSRPVRMLGIQVATDFALRPDLVTTPLPGLAGGGAAVPTATDVIVDGQRQASVAGPAGSFTPAEPSVRNGINTVTTTTRDALGRTVRQTLSTYVSPILLRPGLTAYSAEAGWVREGYGGADRYGPLVGSATVRAGLSDRLTIESHAELSGRVRVGGLGAALGLGAAGLVSASASVSGADGMGAGGQWGVGYDRVARPVSIALRYTRSSAGWRDLAADSGTPTRSHVALATLGFDLARFGTVGVTLIDQGSARPGRATPRFPALTATLPPARFVTASWSARLGQRVNLVASGGLASRRANYLSIGALLLLGPRQHGYVGLTARPDATGGEAQWRRAAAAPGEWGYGGAVTTGGIRRQAADLTYQGVQGRYLAELERVDGRVAARVSARGALAIGGDGLLAADRLTDSFATVDAGHARVTIFRDHRPVGVTDRHGRLIVTDLPAFVATTISVDPQALADDVTVGTVERTIRPAARAGVPVRFDIARSRAATVRLLREDGRPVPAGARVAVNDGPPLPVGLDGQAYLPALADRNVLRVTQGDRPLCAVTFAAPARWRPGGMIGDQTCRAAP